MSSRFDEIASAEEANALLEIQAPDGSLAVYSTSSNVTLTDTLHERWIEMGSDGKVEVVSTQPGRVDEQLELSGGYKLRIRFEPPLSPGKHTFEIQTKFFDSFLKQDEFFTLTIKYPIRHLRFKIKFPRNVPVTSASVVRFDPSTGPTATKVQEDLPSLKQEENSWYEIQWTKENPKINSVYRINWSWYPQRS